MFQSDFIVPAFSFQPAEGVMDERPGAKILGWEIVVNISSAEVLACFSRINGGKEFNGLAVKSCPGVIVGDVQLGLQVASHLSSAKMPDLQVETIQPQGFLQRQS